MRRRAIAPGVLVVALAASGCGGGGGTDNSATAGPVSKAQYSKRAEAICRKTEKQILTEFTAYMKRRGSPLPGGSAAVPIEIQLSRTIVIPAKQQEAEEFQSLPAPQGGEADAAAITTALEEGVEKAEKRPERAAADGTEAFGKANKLMREFGLRC